MKFIIDRSKWLRGEGYELSSLLRISDGKMCCVGQMCLQLGQTPEQIAGTNGISEILIDKLTPDTLKVFAINDNISKQEWVSAAYLINDDRLITDSDREQRLIGLLMGQGHAVEFIEPMEPA